MTDIDSNTCEQIADVDFAAGLSFDAFWSHEKMGEIEQNIQNDKNVGISRRIAFAILTKSKLDLTTHSKNEYDALMDGLENIHDGINFYKEIVQLMESAQARLFSALAASAEHFDGENEKSTE